MRYRILDDDKIFEDIDDVLEYCIEEDYHWDDDYFEEWVNETWGNIEINGTTYYAYEILENANELSDAKDTFCEECNENDWDEARYELRRSQVGETVYIQRYEVEILDDEYEIDKENGTDSIDKVRKFLDEQKILENSEAEKNSKNEDNLIKMFQVIT